MMHVLQLTEWPFRVYIIFCVSCIVNLNALWRYVVDRRQSLAHMNDGDKHASSRNISQHSSVGRWVYISWPHYSV